MKAETPDIDDLAAAILGFIAADGERLSRFLDLTGLAPQTLRGTAAQPGFAANLIDYLCADDRLLVAFAAATDRDPAAIDALHQRLSRPRNEAD